VSNSPLIRTAVNLCLIAAMVIQPMALMAAHGTCAQGQCCQAETVCHSCKCCEVETDGDLCGCCSVADDHAGGCCTAKAKAKSKPDDLFGEISHAVPEPPGASDQSGEGEASFSSCMCGVHSVPFAPAPNRAAVPHVRDLVVIAYLDHVATDAGKMIRPKALTSHLPIGDLSPHFSQRFLCIWRI